MLIFFIFFPPLIQIPEIWMFSSFNEFWERCCLISIVTTEMKIKTMVLADGQESLHQAIKCH